MILCNRKENLWEEQAAEVVAEEPALGAAARDESAAATA